MSKRAKTRIVKVGFKTIGGSENVLIQSMCNIKTENVEKIVSQINECASLGAEMMRVSVMDEKDALAIKEIKKNISIPLVADIHFNYLLALSAIENGADKIRINPGNLKNKDELIKIVQSAKKHHVAIRIGLNSGSSPENSKDNSSLVDILIESAKQYVSLFESLGFYDIVISLKCSDIIQTIEAYQRASKIFNYPLHLGITEASIKDVSLIRSSAGLSPLLLGGIGNTIRISISDEPKEEIVAAKRLLHDLGLYKNYPTLISCPTCGRTEVDIIALSKKVMEILDKVNKPIKVAIMGCVVNGPGEAKNADIGVAGGHQKYVIFKKGIPYKTVSESEVYTELINEINKL